jgi:uncharacterized protein YxeA
MINFNFLKKTPIIAIVIAVFVLYILFRFKKVVIKENEEFTNNTAEELKYEKAPRLMYNLSNQSRNEVYDIRGENMEILKKNVSFLNESNLEKNVLNERVLN